MQKQKKIDKSHKDKVKKSQPQFDFIQPEIGGFGVKAGPEQLPEVSKFNCYVKIINSKIAFALILPASIPQSVGFYARN